MTAESATCEKCGKSWDDHEEKFNDEEVWYECPPTRLMVGFLGEDHPMPVVVDGQVWPDAEVAG